MRFVSFVRKGEGHFSRRDLELDVAEMELVLGWKLKRELEIRTRHAGKHPSLWNQPAYFRIFPDSYRERERERESPTAGEGLVCVCV